MKAGPVGDEFNLHVLALRLVRLHDVVTLFNTRFMRAGSFWSTCMETLWVFASAAKPGESAEIRIAAPANSFKRTRMSCLLQGRTIVSFFPASRNRMK